MTVLFVLALFTAAAAGARSTWSPCGISMLSSITPLSERARGHLFESTASWFMVGSVCGGVTLGALAAILAVGIGALGLSLSATLTIAAVATVLSTGIDLGLFGPLLPHNRRQVNEVWLDQYRGWVYGAGFGFQIGSGFATYIMTAAVYLTVVLAALTANPMSALVLGAVFGLVRGSAVWLGRSIMSPAALSSFHRRFDALGEPVRRVTIGVQLAVLGVTVVAAASIQMILVVVTATVLLGGGSILARRSQKAPVGPKTPQAARVGARNG